MKEQPTKEELSEELILLAQGELKKRILAGQCAIDELRGIIAEGMIQTSIVAPYVRDCFRT